MEAQWWEPWCYGASRGLLGLLLEAHLNYFGSLMGFFWAVSGPFWAVVGRLGGLWPCWGSPGGLVGLSWEPLWALLGLCGGRIGAL